MSAPFDKEIQAAGATAKSAARLPADFVQIPREIFEDVKAGKLKGVDVVTYALVVGHCIDKDYCWVLQSTFAELSGSSVSTVQRSLRNLIRAGHIRSTSRGMNRSRLITLLTRAQPAVTVAKTPTGRPTAMKKEPLAGETVAQWMARQK
jgi:hypothetical protein